MNVIVRNIVVWWLTILTSMMPNIIKGNISYVERPKIGLDTAVNKRCTMDNGRQIVHTNFQNHYKTNSLNHTL